MTQAQSAAHSRATINALPVSSTINSLTRVLGGITLTLGSSRVDVPAADHAHEAASSQPDFHGPPQHTDALALRAAQHYAAVDATTKTSGTAPDGPRE